MVLRSYLLIKSYLDRNDVENIIILLNFYIIFSLFLELFSCFEIASFICILYKNNLTRIVI